MLVYDRQEELLNWAALRLGLGFHSDACGIGWEDDEGIRAVVVYDRHSSVDCCMHIASDGSRRWMTKQFLYAAFAHPFIQWGYRRITGLVAEENTAALKFDSHIGFKHEGVIRNGTPNGNLIVLGLLREECRFI